MCVITSFGLNRQSIDNVTMYARPVDVMSSSCSSVSSAGHPKGGGCLERCTLACTAYPFILQEANIDSQF